MAGTAQSALLGSVAWEAEAAFAQSSDDTITYRMQVRDDQIDVSNLTRELIDRGGVFQYLSEKDLAALGPFGASTFTTSHYLEGHGGTTAGSLTQTDLNRLFAHVFGNVDVTQVGTTVNTPTDADTFTVVGGTILDGGLIRLGALGDARGNGQFLAVDDNSTLQLLTAAGAAPNAADVVYAPMLVYPVSSVLSGGIVTASGAASNNTLRFRLQTGNLQFICRGCVATSVTFTFGDGALPMVTIEWSCVAWNPVSQTFPDVSVATAAKAPAALTAGSLFLQTKGTTTRATEVATGFSVSYEQNMLPIMGTDGATAGQNIVGWRRGPSRTTVSFSVEAEAVTANPTYHDLFATDPNSQGYKHILWTGSVVDGSAIGMYFPKCRPIGNIPTQAQVEGLNFVPLQFEALTAADTDAATTNELSRAAWVLAQG